MTVQQAYERFIATDGDELWRRIDRAQERFVALVGSTGPHVVAAPTAWTTRDVVAHVLTVTRRYTERDVTSTEGLGATPREVDIINERELRELTGVPMTELLADLDAQMSKVKAAFAPDRIDLHQRFPFHGNTTIDAAGALANLIGEFMIHGHDVARGASRPWQIEPRDASLVINAIMQLTAAYAEPSAKGTLDLLFRVPGAADWMLAFDSGKVDSRPADVGEPADVILTSNPETLLLFFYQRLGQFGAVRRGLRVAGGRRPWRIARLQRFLQKP